MNGDRLAGAIARIKAALGPRGWIAGGDAAEPYLTERRALFRGAAALIARPASTEEVAAVIAICAESGIAVVPQGGNTGLVGGGIAGDDAILLNLGRLNRVRAIDPVNDTITVEAGCVLADVQRAAAEADRLFPLSLGAEGSCQIGGNLSTNAGGTNVLHYGSARALVLGLEVVLADGRLWDGLRALRKDNTGYDLKQLFIGGEGTLGVITAAVLKLFPRPRAVETAFAGVADPAAAVALFTHVRAALGDALTACELIPRIAMDFTLRHIPDTRDPLDAPHPQYVLLEASYLAGDAGRAGALAEALGAAIEAGIARDATVAASGEQARAIWRLREGMVEAQRPEGRSISHDVSVPLARVADMIEAATAAVNARVPGARVVAFGHLGDGNIHFNISQPEGADGAAFMARREEVNRVVLDIVAGLGGSFSAEHGVGRLKRDDLARYRPEVEREMMAAIKAALDPQGILNPGKVVP